MPNNTQMAREAAEAPARIGEMLAANAPLVERFAKKLDARRPRLLMTCARGSSDHAATYLQFLSHTRLGLPAASLPPSVASVYRAGIDLSGVLFVVISQSGRSPDLVAGAEWAAAHGATVLALVNDDSSPVAEASHEVLPLHAGPETSVAATKSYLASLAAGAQLVAGLSGDKDLTEGLSALPRALETAAGLDWSAPLASLQNCTNTFVVGRGPGLAAASEMALKFKETSAIHAEAVSSAEIMHGPLGLLQPGMPLLLIGQADATLDSIQGLDSVLTEKGAEVFAAYPGAVGKGALPVVEGIDPALAPLAAVQSFYRMASDLALSRGFDPDRPEHLKKVTETR